MPAVAERSVELLRGVGPARARLLERLGVRSIEDLLLLAPRRIDVYQPARDLERVAELEGQLVRVRGRLRPPGRAFRRGARSLTKAQLILDGGRLEVRWFNQPWAFGRVRTLAEEGATVELLGRIVGFKGGVGLASPRLRRVEDGAPFGIERQAVYPTTAGLGQELLRSLMRSALEEFGSELIDPVPQQGLGALGLPTLRGALVALHGARGEPEFKAAQRRLALEEALCIQARLIAADASEPACPRSDLALELGAAARQEIVTALPHRPTGAQARVLGEVFDDLSRGRPMRRLLQGDVGSGKTLVAAAAALAVARAGKQAALLAPTALLAEQHFLELAPLFEGAGRRVVLLTAALPSRERRAVEAEIARGRADLVIGTHALVSERVSFSDLALAIIDEQQRFGVAAKRNLLAKGAGVHALLVTATPIPRTLALALYGELSLSVIDELPPGRKGITTRVLEPAKRPQALALVQQRLVAGERVFWVCPRIAAGNPEDVGGDGEDIASAERAFRGLSQGSLGVHGAVLVHGALAQPERSARLAAFRNGDARLLVGTSVVEVGLDVPAATLIVVENAERMGLAQLHQLRGRVGRGDRPGHCLLLVPEGGSARLELLEQTSDGFRIADEDLKRRGAGDLAGLAQAGGGAEWDTEWGGDLELLSQARQLLSQHLALVPIYRDRGRADIALV